MWLPQTVRVEAGEWTHPSLAEGDCRGRSTGVVPQAAVQAKVHVPSASRSVADCKFPAQPCATGAPLPRRLESWPASDGRRVRTTRH